MKFKILFLIFLTALAACSDLGADQANHLTAKEAKALIEAQSQDTQFVILDIRTPKEYRAGHISGAINIDYYNPKFTSNLDQLDKTKTYLIYCRSGNRTGNSLKAFSKLGFNNLYHLKRGIIDWQTNKFELITNSGDPMPSKQ